MKWHYVTDKEALFNPANFDLQIALGLRTCKTIQDVLNLLKDVRQHERIKVIKLMSLR